MTMYIGTKKVNTADDYKNLSSWEKTIASRSPDIKKILTGQPTAADKIKASTQLKNVAEKIRRDNKQNLKTFETDYKASWAAKLLNVGQPIKAAQVVSEAPQMPKMQQNETGNNMLIYAAMAGLALLLATRKK